MRRRQFGSTRQLPSGRWQARYTDPGGHARKALGTFRTKREASDWLATEQAAMYDAQRHGEQWVAPEDRAAAAAALRARSRTFGTYAEAWLAGRDLRPRTRVEYERLLSRLILPTFADVPLADVQAVDVRTWYSTALDREKATQRAHAYSLLRTIFNTALADELVAASPCRIRGAGSTKRKREIRPASVDELVAIVEHMPERFRSLVLVAAWCALRPGEVITLRRKDVDLEAGVVRVSRGVVRVAGGWLEDQPKTAAGVRTVALPPHVAPVLEQHLSGCVGPSDEALLWPAQGDVTSHLASSTLNTYFYRARAAAGRPDLALHHLRHTGAVLAALSGATIVELMGRLGHSSPAAAMRYQHIAQGRDAAVAKEMSRLATGGS